MKLFYLLLIIANHGHNDEYILDHGLTREDCIQAIHNSEHRAIIMGGAELSLSCTPEDQK